MMRNDCLIKMVLLVIFGLGFLYTGTSTRKPLGYGQMFVGAILLIFAYLTYTDKSCWPTCDITKWKSLPLIVPKTFEPDSTNITLCDAQEWAQKNSINAFIACVREGDMYDVMYLKGTSFQGKETACTDCKIYFTNEFRVTLEPEDDTNENKDSACPINPYPYCPADEIDNVYVNMNCHASTSLIKKLISEGKLEDTNDPKIVKCCENPEVCRANGVRAFPTMKCKNDVTIQGFCP